MAAWLMTPQKQIATCKMASLTAVFRDFQTSIFCKLYLKSTERTAVSLFAVPFLWMGPVVSLRLGPQGLAFLVVGILRFMS